MDKRAAMNIHELEDLLTPLLVEEPVKKLTAYSCPYCRIKEYVVDCCTWQVQLSKTRNNNSIRILGR